MMPKSCVFLGLACTVSIFVASQNVPPPSCRGSEQCDEGGSSVGLFKLQKGSLSEEMADALQQPKEMNERKNHKEPEFSLDKLGLLHNAKDSDEDGVVKELVISAVCDIHKESDRLGAFFDGADSNRDGDLSLAELEAADVPLEFVTVESVSISKSTFLANTILPMVETMNEDIEHSSSSLSKTYSASLIEMANKIMKGWNPKEFLQVCDLAEAGEPDVGEQLDAIKNSSNVPHTEMLEMGASDASYTEEMDDEEDEEEVSYNTSLFKSLSGKQRKLGNVVAWQSATKAYNKLFMAEFCWKDVWWRGMASLTCKSGWYKGSSGLDSGLCYRSCPSNYYRFGDHCWKNCGSKWNNVGLWCQREVMGKCWPGIPCPEIKMKKRVSKYSPGCSIMNSDCGQECPPKHTKSGLGCYKNPREHGKGNYHCTEAAHTCHRNCGQHLSYKCGGGCALDLPACDAATNEMIIGLVEAVVQTTVLVMSLGASSTATAGKMAMEASREKMKKAAKRNAYRNAKRVQKKVFKQELKKARETIAKNAIKDTLKGKLEEKSTGLLVEYAVRGSAGMSEAIEQKMIAEGKDKELVLLETIDPTGIVTAIDSSVSGEHSDNRIAANWIAVFGTFDPTGVLGAVASFMKHDHCESVVAKAERAARVDNKGGSELDKAAKEVLLEAQETEAAAREQVESIKRRIGYR